MSPRRATGSLVLDSVPLPARHLVNPWRHQYACLAHRPTWLVETARGCPFRCSFCSITNVQKLYAGERFLRFRDPIEVIDEIEADWARYRDYGMRMVSFYDLNFLVNLR